MDRLGRIPWKEVVRIGLLGGVGCLFVSLVGMVGTFHGRDIIGRVISMGQTLILVAILTSAYIAALRARPGGQAAWAGAVSGALSAAVLFALVLIGSRFNLRPVLVNVSPALFQILTFGRPIGLAGPMLLGIGAAIGAAAGLLRSLPDRPRRAALLALMWVALLGLLADLIRVTFIRQPVIGELVRLVFGPTAGRGFTILGVLLLTALVFGISFWAGGRRLHIRDRLNELPARQRTYFQFAMFGLVAVAVYLYPKISGPYLSEVSNSVGLFILMGLGLNIVVGFAGLLDLGYVAFFAIGAYTMGVLTSRAIGDGAGQIVWGPQLSFWQALPIAMGASFLAGILLGVPVLRMRGDYLAIVTLGFGEMIRILALSDFLKPYIGGSQGIVRVEPPRLAEVVLRQPQYLFYLIAIGCALVAFVALRLKDSRLGRAWVAMREDEDVSQAMGINLITTKLGAFAIGATFSGMSGAIFASKLGSIYPHSFSLLISIYALSLIIVGGMGSVPGVFVGALALVALPELLREFAEYRPLVFGAALVAMMLLRPAGFVPDIAHRRELEEEEEPVAVREQMVQAPSAD
jgi:branched-chain amino acid transport system permease protein